MTERELLARIGARDERALERMYAVYYPRLGRFLWRLGLKPDEVEEAINDVFLIVWNKAASFEGASSPSTWIMGIAYNKALKRMKRRRPTAPLDSLLPVGVEPPRDDVTAAVRKLPAKQRAVIVLTFEFGYSYREISQVLGCPENTVKTRMFSARKALRALLEA
jgi:RNA polymerase sigma-70 factor (ECF subfamily)